MRIEDAPVDTKLSASWFAVDVGNAAEPGTVIDTNEIKKQISYDSKGLKFLTCMEMAIIIKEPMNLSYQVKGDRKKFEC